MRPAAGPRTGEGVNVSGCDGSVRDRRGRCAVTLPDDADDDRTGRADRPVRDTAGEGDRASRASGRGWGSAPWAESTTGPKAPRGCLSPPGRGPRRDAGRPSRSGPPWPSRGRGVARRRRGPGARSRRVAGLGGVRRLRRGRWRPWARRASSPVPSWPVPSSAAAFLAGAFSGGCLLADGLLRGAFLAGAFLAAGFIGSPWPSSPCPCSGTTGATSGSSFAEAGSGRSGAAS